MGRSWGNNGHGMAEHEAQQQEENTAASATNDGEPSRELIANDDDTKPDVPGTKSDVANAILNNPLSATKKDGRQDPLSLSNTNTSTNPLSATLLSATKKDGRQDPLSLSNTNTSTNPLPDDGNGRPGAYAVTSTARSASDAAAVTESPSLRVESITTTARLVTDEEDAAKLRRQLEAFQNAPTAVVIEEEETTATTRTKKRKIIKIVLALFLIVGAALLVGVLLAATGTFGGKEGLKGATSNDTNATSTEEESTAHRLPTTPKPTLQTIRERGYIRCRVIPLEYDAGGVSQELCRALAAAVFGSAHNRTRFVTLPIAQLWDGIDNGTVDIATSWNTGTFGRDVFEAYSGQPKSFSVPYFVTGAQVAGRPEFVRCVDDADTITGVCKDLHICVARDTTTHEVIANHMDGAALRPVLHLADLYEGLAKGTCNVIAGEPQYMYEERVREAGYTGDYAFGSSLLSTEPQSMTTKESDPQWTDFSTSVVQALFTAELENITQENATLFPETALFGEEYKHMYQHVVAEVGNWGDVFGNTFGQYIERNAVNLLNRDQRGGLIYAPPLAALEYSPKPQYTNPPGRVANGTLESIATRGRLRCGVTLGRSGFSTATEIASDNSSSIKTAGNSDLTGMDIDLCRCLAVALFRDENKIEFVELEDNVAGFMALTQDLVDVVAGVPYTLQADVREPSTNRGYTFSPIYFRDKEGGLALVTNQDATQWSDFVRWTVFGIIKAEEEGLTKADASQMPSVDLFGPEYSLMFRLTVLRFGNYGDLYERNLEDIFPRKKGCNMLNNGSTPLINPLPLSQFSGMR